MREADRRLRRGRLRARSCRGRDRRPCVCVGDVGALAAALSDVLDHPPDAAAIAAKSAAYSIGAAADGIIRAAVFTISNRRQDPA